jgi:phosphopantothenate-cysteine ligase
MSIALTRATKLIGKVKQWNPKCKLVGFKLLVNSTDEELVDAARRSINKNRCDVVVANDLRDIKAGEHRLLIVTRNGVEEYKTDHKNKNYLANIVAKEVIKLL